MKRVGIIGVGNVGSTIAYNLALNNTCDEILLKDLRDDFIKALSLDITQASISNNSKTITKAISKDNEFKDCDVIIITAGIARTPSMSREDLLIKNANILKNILDNIVKYNQNAIYIIVSNPLDAMVYTALKYSNLKSNQVLGMAGELDSARFKYYIKEALAFKVNNIEAKVIGAHSNFMVPLVSSIKIDGKKANEVLNKKQLEIIIKNTKNGGAKIVDLLKTGSAYFAPATACSRICNAILNDTKEEFICSVELSNHYSLNNSILGTSIIIGKNGVEEIIELDISNNELEALNLSAISILDSLKSIDSLIK
ncbi:malate dehydrogenase [Arcobacter porcinus]|uniref:Malate dehydrogenase, NAD-dependent n=1 Tax=Arcobacter porcinus TaxID=1935204 RepID=A0A5C2HCB8_9BACT|nr:malate dehydrogenase [Arcobacter porcinus]OCL85228.1 Malate dehydrogenase [Arcobacter porcinus]OCL92338.1 Malate dehydrogenase [Aliarcobacter thereius]QEP40469.1 malate dehydrogenase, NAD-dependent [Arcobacter porcinus]